MQTLSFITPMHYRIQEKLNTMKSKKLTQVLAGIFAISAFGSAHAITLTNAQTKSYIDEPLQIEAKVVGAGDIMLPKYTDYLQYGYEVVDYNLSLDFYEKNGSQYLSITTDTPINDPAFILLLRGVDENKRVSLLEIPVILDFRTKAPAPKRAESAVSETPKTAPKTTPKVKAEANAPTVDERPSLPKVTADKVEAGPVASAAEKAVAQNGVTTTKVETVYEKYGPVKQGETIWRIANGFATKHKVPVNDMIARIKKANPKAFPNGVLLANVTLRVPVGTKTVEVAAPTVKADETLLTPPVADAASTLDKVTEPIKEAVETVKETVTDAVSDLTQDASPSGQDKSTESALGALESTGEEIQADLEAAITEKVDEATDKVKEVVDDAKTSLEATGVTVTEIATDLTHDVKEEAEALALEAKEKAQESVEAAKAKLAEEAKAAEAEKTRLEQEAIAAKEKAEKLAAEKKAELEAMVTAEETVKKPIVVHDPMLDEPKGIVDIIMENAIAIVVGLGALLMGLIAIVLMRKRKEEFAPVGELTQTVGDVLAQDSAAAAADTEVSHEHTAVAPVQSHGGKNIDFTESELGDDAHVQNILPDAEVEAPEVVDEDSEFLDALSALESLDEEIAETAQAIEPEAIAIEEVPEAIEMPAAESESQSLSFDESALDTLISEEEPAAEADGLSFEDGLAFESSLTDLEESVAEDSDDSLEPVVDASEGLSFESDLVDTLTSDEEEAPVMEEVEMPALEAEVEATPFEIADETPAEPEKEEILDFDLDKLTTELTPDNVEMPEALPEVDLDSALEEIQTKHEEEHPEMDTKLFVFDSVEEEAEDELEPFLDLEIDSTVTEDDALDPTAELDALMAGVEEIHEAEKGAVEAVEDVAEIEVPEIEVPEVEVAEEEAIDDDQESLDSLNAALDTLEVPKAEAAVAPAVTSEAGDEGDADEEESERVKLELAEAYLDLNFDAALSIPLLNEVIQDGTPEQVEEAKALLARANKLVK